MSWRPEGWGGGPDIYEAGADAMLEALKKKGAWMTPEQMKLLAPDRKYPFGWIVFIPEDKENQGSTGSDSDRHEFPRYSPKPFRVI